MAGRNREENGLVIPSAILFLFCAGNYAIYFCMALTRATDPPRGSFLSQGGVIPLIRGSNAAS
ncbi:hypothetical protein MES5069_10101 [Mesorhizobium escarrei]|uniref:Uncharacterized protein n=1 Tax=Mesorhizobium escarrei TaxID=666018 RepID=A0ABM9DF90_9HYPH|nr:hypothetical protein MES5069_10101 [Mesorhizobium escarrei]